MITYLVTPQNHKTLTKFLAGRGAALDASVRVVAYPGARSTRGAWRPIRYRPRGWRRKLERARSWLEPLRRHQPQPGAFVFSDLERLDADQLDRAAALWSALEEAQLGVRLLNHPRRTLRRYALLRALREAGLNDFDVYRPGEARRPTRFPVFVRREDDHGGSETDLLDSPEALAAAIAELERDGGPHRDRIVTEFRAQRDHRELYRKYSAWRVADRIFPAHLFCGPHWMLKEPVVVDAETVALESAFLDGNPHRAELERAFALARIDYGRADYGLVDGRVQVYEINTNPGLASGLSRRPPGPRDAADRRCAEALVDALRALDASLS